MLTYDFDNINVPIYEYIYMQIKEDILSGVLKPGEKLPSKRAFAYNNGISTITIQNAYEQLISEGYIYAEPKKGYYVSNIEGMARVSENRDISYNIHIPIQEKYEYDLSGNSINSDNFPFSVWTKLTREVMASNKDELMQIAPPSGLRFLREAIANHLKSFRGMLVDPDQIVVGAGTEYLYGVITQLLGKEKIYAIENPGYKKLESIYEHRDVVCRYVSMDDCGVTVDGLLKVNADVAHICPNHHFPTGITMPASRRYDILSWAADDEGRYIIEDDYDSEFRLEGKPIPTLLSIDPGEKVIYMNTFSKSLSPTIRISYMVLPVHLVNEFYKKMSFYACTVSNFEQYTLGLFISRGYFEKHINRMRLYYSKKRKRIIEIAHECGLADKCEILENDSGLHFLIKLKTKLSDEEIEERLKNRQVKMVALSKYYFENVKDNQHLFIVNYSYMEDERVREAFKIIEEII